MKLTARGALRTRQDSRRLSGFGSMWKSGDSVVVYYPIVWDEEAQQHDLLVAMCWGHNANPKEIGLKRIFIPTLSEIVDGEPKVPDVTFQFSRIAPLFIQGAKDKKLKELQEKNMAESARKTAMKKVEDEFEDMQPAIGKLRLVISTECVVVPLDPTGQPDSEKARLVSQDLSDSKINALLSILSDHKYKVDKDAKWIEVQYSFGTSGKKSEDGKVSPQGITDEYKLAHKYPDHWSRIEQQLSGLPDNDVTIFKRNSSFRPVEEREIISAISTYAAIESEALDAIEDEDGLERLKRNAAVILDLKIPIANEEVLTAVNEVAEKRAEAEAAGASKVEAKAPTMSGIMAEHEQERRDARAAEEELSEQSLLDRATDAGVGEGAPDATGGLGNLGALA